jgi:hypothetical protein
MEARPLFRIETQAQHVNHESITTSGLNQPKTTTIDEGSRWFRGIIACGWVRTIHCKNERMSWLMSPADKTKDSVLVGATSIFHHLRISYDFSDNAKRKARIGSEFYCFLWIEQVHLTREHHFRISRLTSITLFHSCLFATDYSGIHPTPVSWNAMSYTCLILRLYFLYFWMEFAGRGACPADHLTRDSIPLPGGINDRWLW